MQLRGRSINTSTRLTETTFTGLKGRLIAYNMVLYIEKDFLHILPGSNYNQPEVDISKKQFYLNQYYPY